MSARDRVHEPPARASGSADEIARAAADFLGIEFDPLDQVVLGPELFSLLPAAQAIEHNVAPRAQRGQALEVVFAEPLDLALVQRIERLCRREIVPVLSTAQRIEQALRRSQGAGEVLRSLSAGFEAERAAEGDAEPSRSSLTDSDSPVARLLDTLLSDALQKRASDIHVETGEDGLAVKYRIDGVLVEATGVLDRSHHAAVLARLKVMAELDLAEKRRPQDGRFSARIGGRDIDFRISIMPSVHGEDAVLRILDKAAIAEGFATLNFDALGIEPQVLARLRRAVNEPYGMVLITGPTGSGKTTTLYAALSELNTGQEKIITIEDPVEYRLRGVVQIPVNEKKGLTFALGLRSILRHDPDKIMVGEIRDLETAQIAVQSALTGHLVFTTVHANNVFDVVSRFTHMGVDVANFVSALNCVMAQRLLRLLCPHCKRAMPASPVQHELLERSGLPASEAVEGRWYEAVGCPRCHGTGYRGRAAVTEFLGMSPALRRAMIERRPVEELQAMACAAGLVTLRANALERARRGDTSLKEINRVTFVE